MSKEIHYCEVCNVSSKEKNVHKRKIYNKYLCDKHFQQLKKHGKLLDNSQRGVFDKNEIRILEKFAEIDTYDSHGNIVETYILDLDCVNKLKTYKWRTIYKNKKPYLITGNQKSNIIYFHKIVMQTKLQVDHISGDTRDNRLENLREATIQENMMNLKKKSNSTTGIRGVSFNKIRNTWAVDFTVCKIRLYLKSWKLKEEAVYLRYLCEINLLKDRRNTSNDNVYFENINKLSIEQKNSIEKYFKQRINTTKVGV